MIGMHTLSHYSIGRRWLPKLTVLAPIAYRCRRFPIFFNCLFAFPSVRKAIIFLPMAVLSGGSHQIGIDPYVQFIPRVREWY
jgi:hypothetical protein